MVYFDLKGRRHMTVGTLQIDGRKFRIIPENEYKAFRAALRAQQRLAKQDAADVAEAERRLRDPKRKTIPLGRLKAQLGL
jgi:hypothetical protein